jgi:gamma-glutamylcyclotransferase (GGCT)/AIG2-like uncharacterized protein YtfP
MEFHAMEQTMHQVFVYGTLLQGEGLHHVLATSRYLGPGFLEGADMFDLGSYPGIVPGTGTVCGECYAVDEAVLATLDEVEGFVPGGRDNLYTREVRSVRLLCGECLSAFVYFFAGTTDPSHAIAGGDYRRYRAERAGGASCPQKG